MNIILPICANLVILAILIIGIFVGRKNGFKYEFIKLFILLASCAGLYFLSPILTDTLLKIEAVQSIGAYITNFAAVLNSAIYLVLFLIVYFIVCQIIGVIRIHNIKKYTLGINSAKRTKAQGIDRKTSKQIRKEEKKTEKIKIKEAIKERKRRSKVFGAITGLITAVLVAFIIFFPVKYASKSLSEILEKPEIETTFEYTPYGQLDKITDIYNIMQGE